MQAVRRSAKSASVVASHFHRAKAHANCAVLALQHRLKVVVRAISALKDATRAVLAAAASLELIRATHARRALSASSPAALPRWYAQTVPRAVLPIVLPLWRARHVTLANLATPRVLRRARIARRGTSLSSPRPSYASSAIVERSLRVRARANALHAPEGSPARAAPQRALTARRVCSQTTTTARTSASFVRLANLRDLLVF